MNLTLAVWRQQNADAPGRFETYEARNLTREMPFLEMLDVVNEELILEGRQPIAFDHDCREGICGTCGFVISGRPHGPWRATTVCQLHLRAFKDGEQLVLEPWRAAAFPVVKDLIVDRSALDRIVQAGGYIDAPTGSAPEANAILVPKARADLAFDAAACIGCGACAAACPNASAMLFTAAKVSHLGLLPQGQPGRAHRALDMVGRMDAERFGGCTNHGECEGACPKNVGMHFIARLNRDLLKASLLRPKLEGLLHAVVEA